ARPRAARSRTPAPPSPSTRACSATARRSSPSADSALAQVAAEYAVDEVAGEDAKAGRRPDAAFRVGLEVRNVGAADLLGQDRWWPASLDGPGAVEAGGDAKRVPGTDEPPLRQAGGTAVQRVEEAQRPAAPALVDQHEDACQVDHRPGGVQRHGGGLVGVQGGLEPGAGRRVLEILAEADDLLGRLPPDRLEACLVRLYEYRQGPYRLSSELGLSPRAAD